MMDFTTMSQNNKTNSLWTEISKFMNQDKFKPKLFISGLLLVLQIQLARQSNTLRYSAQSCLVSLNSVKCS